MGLFPATKTLESAAIDLLGSLTHKKLGDRFLLVMANRFKKLT